MMRRKLMIYIVVHVLISLGYIIILLDKFSLPWFTVTLHLTAILLVHLILFLLASVFRVLYFKLANFLISLLLAIYWLALLLIYILNWISNTNWGSNVKFDLISQIPDQIDIILDINDWSLIGFVLSVLLVLFLTLVTTYYLVKPVYKYYIDNFVLFNRFVVYAIGVVIFFIFYLQLTFSPKNPRHWEFEPILSAFTQKYSIFDTPRSKFEELNDKNIRNKHLKELNGFTPERNVVLIIVDSLRADKMPLYGYVENTTPFLNKLDKENELQKVNYFTSTCPESTCSIYSIFSSRNASRIGMGLYDLTDVLKGAGYKTEYIISARHDYNGLSDFYSKSLDSYITGYDFKSPYSLYDDEGLIYYLELIEKNNFNQPKFLYLHMMSAHYLGTNKTENNKYLPQEEFFLRSQSTDDLDTARLKASNAYNNGLLQTDRYIEKVFKILTEKDYLKNAVVIIVGDHGEGLGERGYFSHTYYNYHEDINVPFLFYDSQKQCNLKNTRYGTQIDLAPTILDCLDIEIPSSWQGISLFEEYKEDRVTFHQSIREEKEVMVILENSENMFKLMATKRRDQFINYRLYNYYKDPKEKNNLIDSADPKLVAFLKNQMQQEFK